MRAADVDEEVARRARRPGRAAARQRRWQEAERAYQAKRWEADLAADPELRAWWLGLPDEFRAEFEALSSDPDTPDWMLVELLDDYKAGRWRPRGYLTCQSGP